MSLCKLCALYICVSVSHCHPNKLLWHFSPPSSLPSRHQGYGGGASGRATAFCLCGPVWIPEAPSGSDLSFFWFRHWQSILAVCWLQLIRVWDSINNRDLYTSSFLCSHHHFIEVGFDFWEKYWKWKVALNVPQKFRRYPIQSFSRPELFHKTSLYFIFEFFFSLP